MSLITSRHDASRGRYKVLKLRKTPRERRLMGMNIITSHLSMFGLK